MNYKSCKNYKLHETISSISGFKLVNNEFSLYSSPNISEQSFNSSLKIKKSLNLESINKICGKKAINIYSSYTVSENSPTIC